MTDSPADPAAAEAARWFDNVPHSWYNQFIRKTVQMEQVVEDDA